MLKRKSIDYIFGMITGASLMVAFWACTSHVTATSTIQQVEVVNESWNPVNVTSVDQMNKDSKIEYKVRFAYESKIPTSIVRKMEGEDTFIVESCKHLMVARICLFIN